MSDADKRCAHPREGVRFVQDDDVLVPWVGRCVCSACGSSQRVAGDHDGPWHPPGVEPTWEVPLASQLEAALAIMTPEQRQEWEARMGFGGVN